MAVQGSAGVSICCKTRLKCRIAGGLVALQVGRSVSAAVF
jgi:hypothetical protein